MPVKKKSIQKPITKTDQPKIPKEVNKKKFSWKNQFDINHDDFFREGNYLPPAVLMEVSRRPTDENIKRYLAYFKLKNAVMNKTISAIASYAKKIQISSSQKREIEKSLKPLPRSTQGNENFQVSMFFRSDCPHCKRMFATLSKLQSQGIYVEARQLDSGAIRFNTQNVVIGHANQKDRESLKKLNVQAVPFTIIKHVTGKTFSIESYRSFDEMITLIENLKNS